MNGTARLGDLADVASVPEILTLSWPPVSITVGSWSRLLLERVLHHYRLHFSTKVASSRGAALVCVVDAGLAANLTGRVAAGHSAHPAGFRLAALPSDDPAEPAALATGHGVRVLVTSSDGPRSAAVAIRQIRATTAATLCAAGWVPVHASAVVDQRGSTLVMFGPRRAGKTTMLLSLLRAGAMELLANDTVFLRGDGRLLARGLPVSIGIRPDTLALFPELRQAIGADVAAKVDPACSDVSEPVGSATRMHVSPDDVAAAFGVAGAKAGSVRSLVRLRFDQQPSAFAVRRLSGTELMRSLAQARLETDAEWASAWTGGTVNRTPQPIDLTSVLSFELIYGANNRLRAADRLRSLV